MNIARYTQKQIDKYQRQKYIGELEKVAKNLFRMFRDKSSTVHSFVTKFRILKEKLDEREETHLDAEYHRELKAYINRLYQQTCQNEAFGEDEFDDIREAEMSNLNRLQKMKNSVSYKKEKHRTKHHEEWE